MNIQYRVLPVARGLTGWRRLCRRISNFCRGTLVLDFRRPAIEPAD